MRCAREKAEFRDALPALCLCLAHSFINERIPHMSTHWLNSVSLVAFHWLEYFICREFDSTHDKIKKQKQKWINSMFFYILSFKNCQLNYSCAHYTYKHCALFTHTRIQGQAIRRLAKEPATKVNECNTMMSGEQEPRKRWRTHKLRRRHESVTISSTQLSK